MRKFQFSMETLLALRRAKLEQQEQQLAAAVTDYNRGQEAMRSNRQASAGTWNNLRGSGHGSAAGQELNPWQSHSDYLYLARLEGQSREIDGQMHEAHLAMEVEQKRYAEMRKDLRVVEKLREQQLHEYKREREREQDESAAEMSRARELLRPDIVRGINARSARRFSRCGSLVDTAGLDLRPHMQPPGAIDCNGKEET